MDWQVRANNGISYTCSPGTKPNETSFDPVCVDNPQSDGYKQMVRDIDQVAKYFGKMQKQGIAVIWRPLHEGADTYKKLWRFLYDRLVNYHKLNNLIWVWNSQMGDHDWYLGDGHKYAGKLWWQDAFNSGVVVDRDEWKNLMNQQQ